MKKLIALIVLMSGLVVTVQAEVKALIVNSSNKTETLTVKEGQVATVLFWGLTDVGNSNNDKGSLTITMDGKKIRFSRFSFALNSSSGYPLFALGGNFHPVVPGPAEIQLDWYSTDSMLTVKIEDDSGVNSKNNVTVIPETADDSTLVLEGSDDMVNWIVETLGDKPKVNRKKFYRLRAVKN
jgi:hypothetical protein